MRIFVLVVSMFLSACVPGAIVAQSTGSRALTVIPTTSTWEMPAQLTPAYASFGPQAVREEIFTANIPALGQVRGTRGALAYIEAPLPSRPGANRTFAPCRRLVTERARMLGATRVDATSLGPERRVQGGAYEASVGFRIFYANAGVTEVRQSVLTCKTTAQGNVLDAFEARTGPNFVSIGRVWA